MNVGLSKQKTEHGHKSGVLTKTKKTPQTNKKRPDLVNRVDEIQRCVPKKADIVDQKKAPKPPGSGEDSGPKCFSKKEPPQDPSKPPPIFRFTPSHKCCPASPSPPRSSGSPVLPGWSKREERRVSSTASGWSLKEPRVPPRSPKTMHAKPAAAKKPLAPAHPHARCSGGSHLDL